MNLRIRGIVDAGATNKERLVIEVLKDDDIGYYMIFDTFSYPDGKVSSKPKYVYWFPDKKVKTGDLVILYTKNGVANEHLNKNGSTSHFFYWGITDVLWTQPEAAAILLETRTWAVTKALPQPETSAHLE